MLVAPVAPVHIGPLDGDAGQALDLLDLPGQGMAVVGITGQCLHSDDELASRGARVGDRDGGLYPELVARPRLARLRFARTFWRACVALAASTMGLSDRSSKYDGYKKDRR